jgi:hypothetical protein
MSWTFHHAKSERFASEAEIASKKGDVGRAIELYEKAATAEVEALNQLDPSKTRTLGITVVSAVALWYKAKNYINAQRLAHQWLGTNNLPGFAVDQLQLLLQTIWSDQVRERAGIRFSRGEVIISVRGGQIVTGGAPLDLILSKVETVQSLFFRTTEFIKGLPHRKHGPAPTEVQQICRPWLFQTAPGSYQFAVAIEEPVQQDLFLKPTPSSQDIATTFLKILRASADDPDTSLTNLVPDSDYRDTFMKLTRNLAPTGESFSQLEVKYTQELKPVTLLPSSRKSISEAIRRQFPKPPTPPEDQQVTLRGVLRALHLDQDWLELAIETQHVRVEGVVETVDDILGPLVNRNVIVEALRKPTGRYVFQDIQGAE